MKMKSSPISFPSWSLGTRKSLVACLALALSCVTIARGQTLEWTRQLGTSSDDHGIDVSADGLGNVYISGTTFGSLGGPSAGGRDAFLAKYDAGGTLQWTEQLGTSEKDSSNSVSADGQGGVYISGRTEGSLAGTNAGDFDAFISKYDASGTLEWTRQLGTSSFDGSGGVSADGQGGVYISGTTRGSLGGRNAGENDAFVARFADNLKPGDTNGDGLVDFLDFEIIRDNFLTGTTRGEGDLTGDGIVNFDDFGLWKDIFNGAAPVPEQSAFALASLLALFALVGRPRRHA